MIIPVKYGFPEMWKWGVVLDRFAKSQGNTIGLMGAVLMHNGLSVAASAEFAIYPEVGPGPAWTEGVSIDDASLVRETIVIGSLAPFLVQDALPVLLRQLGIPIDAVGVILKYRQRAEQVWPDVDTSSIADTDENVASDQTQSS